MKTIKLLTLVCATALLTACVTATEMDFGNAARAVAAGQTMNPNGTPAAPEAGDGQRLESVVTGYRENVGNRDSVGDEIRFGLGSEGL